MQSTRPGLVAPAAKPADTFSPTSTPVTASPIEIEIKSSLDKAAANKPQSFYECSNVYNIVREKMSQLPNGITGVNELLRDLATKGNWETFTTACKRLDKLIPVRNERVTPPSQLDVQDLISEMRHLSAHKN